MANYKKAETTKAHPSPETCLLDFWNLDFELSRLTGP